MIKLRKNKKAGFTLIELLIVILIIGILAAVGLPLYFGYIGDAKTAEAKGLVGSMWTAMRGCAQSTPGSPCTSDSQFGRTGLNATGITPDGRWTIRSGDNVIMDAATSVFTLTNGILATGTGTDLNGISVELVYNIAVDPPGSFLCTAAGVTSAC